MTLLFATLASTLPLLAVAGKTTCQNATGACLLNGRYACLTDAPLSHLNDTAPLPNYRPGNPAVHSVPWSQRCDGHADCGDGSDEMHCGADLSPHAPDHPSHIARDPQHDECESLLQLYKPADIDLSHACHPLWRANRGFHAQFSMSTCIGCQCVHGEVALDRNHPWWQFAVAAKPQVTTLAGRGDVPPPLVNVPPMGIGCHPTDTVLMTIRLFKKSRWCRLAVCCAEQLLCFACIPSKTSGCKCHECPSTPVP